MEHDTDIESWVTWARKIEIQSSQRIVQSESSDSRLDSTKIDQRQLRQNIRQVAQELLVLLSQLED
jgi:hypothetical protein